MFSLFTSILAACKMLEPTSCDAKKMQLFASSHRRRRYFCVGDIFVCVQSAVPLMGVQGHAPPENFENWHALEMNSGAIWGKFDRLKFSKKFFILLESSSAHQQTGMLW